MRRRWSARTGKLFQPDIDRGGRTCKGHAKYLWPRVSPNPYGVMTRSVLFALGGLRAVLKGIPFMGIVALREASPSVVSACGPLGTSRLVLPWAGVPFGLDSVTGCCARGSGWC